MNAYSRRRRTYGAFSHPRTAPRANRSLSLRSQMKVPTPRAMDVNAYSHRRITYGVSVTSLQPPARRYNPLKPEGKVVQHAYSRQRICPRRFQSPRSPPKPPQARPTVAKMRRKTPRGPPKATGVDMRPGATHAPKRSISTLPPTYTLRTCVLLDFGVSGLSGMRGPPRVGFLWSTSNWAKIPCKLDRILADFLPIRLRRFQVDLL